MSEEYWMTSRDFRADPDVAKLMEEREQWISQMEGQSKAAQLSLLKDLAGVGVDVSSVYDLVNRDWDSHPYPNALPVLVQHLEAFQDGVIVEGIARALSVPDAAFAFPALVRKFRVSVAAQTEDDVAMLQALSIALATVVSAQDEEEYFDLLELQLDPDLVGYLMGGLARLGTPRSIARLRGLAKQPQFAVEANAWLEGRGGSL